ncbi:YjjG family noncanonical pyrimidine nucleotidase [bacterium]|nr:YjjG family noncanonical pyrimidine nucleotidase [bacterium]
MKTVLLDIDDTIFDFTLSAKAAILSAAKEFKIAFTEEMFSYYMQLNELLWEDYENCIIEREDIFKIRFPKLFEHFNIPSNGIDFEAAFQEHFKTEYIFMDGAKNTIEYLAKKYELYVVSNSMYETQYCRLTKAGICKYFKEIFVSDKIGHQKPTKDFFDCCFKNIPNFNPKDTIIIGDSLTSDIAGGNNAGIKTCWFNYKKIPNTKHEKSDYEITNWEEIKSVL